MDSQAIETLKEKIKDVKIAMLTTEDEDGSLRSRPMSTNEMDEDGTLWFFTQNLSPKVDEINRNHRVNISYASANADTYVSVSGDAVLVQDRQKIKELWNDILKAWFPKGQDDPTVALLKVTINKAEYWDQPGGRMVSFFKIAKALVTGEKHEEGQHEKLNFQG